MRINSWTEWWIIRKCFLAPLAKKEKVEYKELEICFRLQNEVCEGVG
jgi:hypothetical protein